MYDWRVHQDVCRACAVLEAQAGNDTSSPSLQRGAKYAVYRDRG